MAVTIQLPLEEEVRLRKRAARIGQDLDSFVYNVVLREAIQESYLEDPPGGQSLAEALEGFIGVLDSSKNNGGEVSHMAENTGEEFTKILEEKHKAGYL